MSIQGAGGKPKRPKESPDTLQSRSTVKLIDLISEGPIVGLVDGAKSIYLDKTPVQNSDNSYNFKGFTYDSRTGTQNQGYLPNIAEGVESETSVGVEVKVATGSVTRTITNSNTDAVKVRIAIPALVFQDEKGNVKGTDVEYRILVKSGTGAFVERVRDRVEGKTSSQYERQYYISLSPPSPWEIQVERITADSDSDRLQNRTVWQSYTEVVEAKFRYPNSAIVGFTFDAEQFNSVPERAYDIKGLLLKIPSNASVRADGSLTYSGAWNGTFQTAWCANPAWCYYDLLTNPRYGCGIPESQVDKWSLYGIGQYCDELVSDGYGGQEPRFTLHAYIQERREAYDLLNALTSVFRGVTYWGAGTVTAVQDAPKSPVRQFTQANVKDGMFNYSGSAKRARHTVAVVKWSDPRDFYQTAIEVIEDIEGIRRLGVRETDVVAFGCTSRGQARRVGKWLLFSERLETDTVNFTVAAEGIPVRPGEIIKIGDPKRAGVRRWGRIRTATTTVVTLDAPVTIESGKTYTLSVTTPANQLEERAVTTAPGAARVLSVNPGFSIAPASESSWILAASDLKPQLFRVLGVSEAEAGKEYAITALVHYPDKYAVVEQDIKFQPPTVSRDLNAPVRPVGGLTARAIAVINQDGSRSVSITVDWVESQYNGQADPQIGLYLVEYNRDSTGWKGQIQTTAATATFDNLAEGIYRVRVAAVNINDKSSSWTYATANASLLDQFLTEDRSFLLCENGDRLAQEF